MSDTQTQKECRTCEGCGKLADTDDAEPWSVWLDMPPGADLAVRAGIVKPVPCPVCAGSGTVAADDEQSAAIASLGVAFCDWCDERVYGGGTMHPDCVGFAGEVSRICEKDSS